MHKPISRLYMTECKEQMLRYLHIYFAKSDWELDESTPSLTYFRLTATKRTHDLCYSFEKGWVYHKELEEEAKALAEFQAMSKG